MYYVLDWRSNFYLKMMAFFAATFIKKMMAATTFIVTK
jgi:hypothetical protein